MSRGKLVAVSLVWLVLLGIGVLTYKLVFAPWRSAAQRARVEEQEEQAARDREQQRQQSGSASIYRHEVDFQIDSFSGYAVIRSPKFQEELRNQGIRLNLQPDSADYLKRIKALRQGDADMAVFTIDALVKVCAEINDLPATIVAIVDETTGADAIVAYKQVAPNIDALNRGDTRFVLVGNSPSETLARVVMTRFELDKLDANPFILVNSPEEVLEHYKRAKPGDPLAYVLWEPYVTQMLKNPEMHVVLDSSHFPSAIVDVIVASSDFLIKNPEVVKSFVEAYLRAVYAYRDRGDMVQLVIQDAKDSGSPLSPQEAERLVDGILWKNTQENLAHMGYLQGTSLPHIENMIENITDVLKTTRGIARDPTDGHANHLYHSQVLEKLQNFHPGERPEEVRERKLPPLTDQQWEELTEVGTARVPSLVFARGTARLTPRSEAVLDELAETLQTTRFYVSIRGNASLRGNLEDNKILARQRAEAAERYLVGKGVAQQRVRAVAVEPSGNSAVSFVLGQLAY